MSELTIYFNDPSGSFMALDLPVSAEDLSAQINDWIDSVPSGPAPATPEPTDLSEGDWIGAQLAKGRKDLFDSRKGDLALTAAAKAEMEEALGLTEQAEVGTPGAVRSGATMSFVVGGKTMIVHRSQILYAVVKQDSPTDPSAPLPHLPPPPFVAPAVGVPTWKGLASSLVKTHVTKRVAPKAGTGSSF